MALSFSKENQERIQTLLGRYPTKMAACLPVLHLAQQQFGFLSPEAQELVARTLELELTHVHGVATFYSMFNKRPVGRYHVQVCTNVSCLLCGASETMSRLQRKLGIAPGETTADGLFTLTEVECLAYCGTAPAVQVNDDVYELVGENKAEELIDQLRAAAAASGPVGGAGA